jgi:hypothetical protein
MHLQLLQPLRQRLFGNSDATHGRPPQIACSKGSSILDRVQTLLPQQWFVNANKTAIRQSRWAQELQYATGRKRDSRYVFAPPPGSKYARSCRSRRLQRSFASNGCSTQGPSHSQGRLVASLGKAWPRPALRGRGREQRPTSACGFLNGACSSRSFTSLQANDVKEIEDALRAFGGGQF